MKISKNLYIGVVAAVSLSSCSDYLTPSNPSAANESGEDYIIKNPTELRATTYNAFCAFVSDTWISMHDQGADLFINPRSGDDGTFSRYTFNPSNSNIEKYYKNVYSAINYANAMIKYNGEDSKYGWEGKFFRAYGYYLLTQQFGEVPYVTYYIQDSNREYPRIPLEEIYESEIASLEDVYNNTTMDNTNHDGFVSKQAVASLLSYYYLAAAWDLDTEIVNDIQGSYKVNSTERFKKSAAWAEKAINGVQLTQSFEDKWSPFVSDSQNPEHIFSFQYLRSDQISRGHSLQNNYVAYYGDCTKTGQKGTKSGGTDMPSNKALYLYEKGDLRWDATFMGTCYNATATINGKDKFAAWGNEGYFAYWNCTAEQLAEQKIAYRFWPYYVTEKEAEAELALIKDRIAKPAKDDNGNDTYGVMNTKAAILTDTDVVVYTMNEDGSYTKTKNSFDDFYTKADGNGACVKKFDDPVSGQVTSGACYRNIPLYHVSEMYLVAAEAYLLAGEKASALAKINAVRNRAGLPGLGSFDDYIPNYVTPSDYDFIDLDLVLDERARELYAERSRWFDVKRTKQLVRYNLAFARSITERSDMCNASGEVKWLRPIPESEINYNTAISSADQNPGY